MKETCGPQRWQELIESVRKRATAMATKALDSVHDAEDAVQEAWEVFSSKTSSKAILQNWEDGAIKWSFIRTVSNKCLEMARRRRWVSLDSDDAKEHQDPHCRYDDVLDRSVLDWLDSEIERSEDRTLMIARCYFWLAMRSVDGRDVSQQDVVDEMKSRYGVLVHRTTVCRQLDKVREFYAKVIQADGIENDTGEQGGAVEAGN